jgi:hypothetical protein
MKKIILVLLAFLGCRKLDENGFKTYKIKKGKHRSGVRIKRDWKSTINFQVIFDESSKYTSVDPVNQADINKLYGVSDCGDHHLQSSIRIGWRWYNDSLELHWFKHQFGDFSFGKIKSVELNEIINCTIELDEDKYIISVDGVTKETSRSCGLNYQKYYLHPYFGGDETAPHDITIKIKE